MVPACDYDAVVVGAGPYGLSAAAHLIGRGLRVGLFGRPFATWRHMPDGMLLRSNGRSYDLSDPRRLLGFADFARQTGTAIAQPIPVATFAAYGLWFQQRAVPAVDPTGVDSVDHAGGIFSVTCADGRLATSNSVVIAVGLRPYARRPALYRHLPRSL